MLFRIREYLKILLQFFDKAGFRFSIHVTGQKERLGRGGSESLHQL
jgi:hypothetical protein